MKVREALGLAGPSVEWADERLVEACLAGDEAAWEALIQKYKRLIYAIPYRHGAQADDAADLFQMVCVELYEELPRLRKVESLRSWLITVAARFSLKWKMKKGRQTGEDVDLDRAVDEDAVGGEEWMEGAERAQLVNQAMERLSERCRTMVRRLFFDDPPVAYEDLARELGLATGSIGFTRGRCLDKLRKELLELGL